MTEEHPVPATPEPVEEGERAAAIARVRDVYGHGGLSREELEIRLQSVLVASSRSELEEAIAPLPKPVRFTPLAHRASHPIEVKVRMNSLDLGAGWQLAAQTTVSASSSSVVLDLRAASWDANEVDLRVSARMSSVEVIIPAGVAVVLVGTPAGVLGIAELAPAFPGAPVLRVEATARASVIRFANEPTPPNGETRRRRRGRNRGEADR